MSDPVRTQPPGYRFPNLCLNCDHGDPGDYETFELKQWCKRFERVVSKCATCTRHKSMLEGQKDGR